MQFSNTKEDGLETIIVDWLVKHNGCKTDISPLSSA